MKPIKTLKDILELPIQLWKYVAVSAVDFCNYENSGELYFEFREFIARAIEEKKERDFGEPMRWIIIQDFGEDGVFIKCPKCKEEIYLQDWAVPHSYCMSCGQKLILIEKNKNEV